MGLLQLRDLIFAIQGLTQEQIDMARDFDMVINITSLPEGRPSNSMSIVHNTLPSYVILKCSPFFIFIFNGHWAGPREVVLREGCAWMVLGR